MAALAAPATGTPRTGSASGHLGGTPTHCFCVGFEDYSACFFSQTGGVGRVVVADGAATTTKMGGGVDDGGLADLLVLVAEQGQDVGDERGVEQLSHLGQCVRR